MNRFTCVITLLLVWVSGHAEVSNAVLNKLNPDSREDVLQVLSEANEIGLPLVPLERKIMEGLAKGKSGAEIVKALEYRFSIMMEIKSENPAVTS